MRIDGIPYRTIWPLPSGQVRVIDQTRLPFELVTKDLASLEDAAAAIRAMVVRGAPLIGATAAWGVALALRARSDDAGLESALHTLAATRPTAVNLRMALEHMRAVLAPLPAAERPAAAREAAQRLCDADVEQCRAIGAHGRTILEGLARAKAGRLNILTHCNAGWLACVDWGTALAPIYAAHDAGLALHVWVDETRPRNQGASLTAFELAAHGIAHTVITDNLGGLLMQRAEVDVAIVGSDRTTAHGDVCNKVGTYLKALAARDNGVPFYVALPSTTIDWSLTRGADIPIEERGPEEVTHVTGRSAEGRVCAVRVVPEGSPVLNLGFDITPAPLVTALITERGICPASREGLLQLFPERGGRT